MEVVGNHMWCQETNLGQYYAKQMSYCYTISPAPGEGLLKYFENLGACLELHTIWRAFHIEIFIDWLWNKWYTILGTQKE